MNVSEWVEGFDLTRDGEEGMDAKCTWVGNRGRVCIECRLNC